MKFKIGDIVRPTAKSAWANCPYWGFPGKVTDIVVGNNIIIEMLEGPETGSNGGFRDCDLELVDVNKSMTDQELADKYRKLRKEGEEVGTLLKQRGYEPQVMRNGTGYWNRLAFDHNPQYRFVKSEIVTNTSII